MTQDELKQATAKAAIEYVVEGAIIGVGTGSTVNFFIEELAAIKHKLAGAVSSSEASTQRLLAHGIPVLDLNDVSDIPVYVDGADEVDGGLSMIKGGGGALTREKIIAAVARRFICIADGSKSVPVLGRFPLPVEVIPMARAHVARQLTALGGTPKWREGFVTDNGNLILDVHGLSITDPAEFEQTVNNIVGVVANGLFARRGADVVLLARPDGIETIVRS